MLQKVDHQSVATFNNSSLDKVLVSLSQDIFKKFLEIGKNIFRQYGSDFDKITLTVPTPKLAYEIYINLPDELIEIADNLINDLNTAGIVILKQIPDEILCDDVDTQILFFILNCILGTPTPGNVDGTIIYPIITKQIAQNKVVQEGNERRTNSMSPLPFHTDTGTYNSLLCINQGGSGGLNEIVSSVAVHNYIHKHRYDLLEELYTPRYLDRRGEQRPEESPYGCIPVFKQQNGLLMTTFPGNYHITAEDKYDLAQSDKHKEAGQFLNETIKKIASESKIIYEAKRGQMIVLNNNLSFHNRNEFESKDRKILRCWVHSFSYPTLPHIWGYPYEQ